MRAERERERKRERRGATKLPRNDYRRTSFSDKHDGHWGKMELYEALFCGFCTPFSGTVVTGVCVEIVAGRGLEMRKWWWWWWW